MDVTTRLLVEAGCVSLFVITLAVAGVRVAPRLLMAFRYSELRAARYPASKEWPKPDFGGFILWPLLAVLAIGGPALTLFFLIRAAGGWPKPLPAVMASAAWLLLAGALALLSSRSEWADVRGVLARALAAPAESRDEIIVSAFEEDPQLRAAKRAEA